MNWPQARSDLATQVRQEYYALLIQGRCVNASPEFTEDVCESRPTSDRRTGHGI